MPEGAGERITVWCGWTDLEGATLSGNVDLRCSTANAERMEAWVRRWLMA